MENLQNLQYMGTIMKSPSGKPILKIYHNKNSFFVLDVVLSTQFRRYYAYETTKENLLNFLKIKKTSLLSPMKNQKIYEVDGFDLTIYDVKRIGKSLDVSTFTLCGYDTWECIDCEQILKKLS